MKMKAAVIRQMGLPQPYADSKPMSIEEVELDKPGQREVLVQIKAASLRHSDLSTINADRPRQMPMVLGHEAKDPDAIQKVKDLTGGGVRFAFEMAGSVQAMELAYRITRRGGTTVSAGLPHPDHRWPLQQVNMVAEERTIRGSYMGSCVPSRDIPLYIDLFRRGMLPVNKLMSDHITLEDINVGFDRLASGHTVRQIIMM